MVFQSILFDGTSMDIESAEQPTCFPDLNLDQVIKAIIKDKKEYNLEKYFYIGLQDNKLVRYRNEIMQDLDNQTMATIIKNFAERMVLVKRFLKLLEDLNFEYYKKSWVLETALEYGEAVTFLYKDLKIETFNSRGMNEFISYLESYINNDPFNNMMKDALMIKDELSKVAYSININAGKVTVKKYEDEEDYSIDVLKTFERFKQGETKEYKAKLIEKGGMDQIDAKILDCVIRLFPEPFKLLDNFCNNYKTFVNDKILLFDREIQFYISYLNFINRLRNYGQPFCYPTLVDHKNEVYCFQSIDLALALRSLRLNEEIVPNDFTFTGRERIIVVTGPNQGGKTTFARMFGQMHYLSLLGCPIPGSKAQLYLSDKILTHFEKEETISTLQGKLKDELKRIYDIFEAISPKSILVVNEIFNSTTLQDAIFLSKKIMQKIEELDIYCVIVTFIDEISNYSNKTVSMVSTMADDDSDIRTFKIVRKPANGLAYAISIAKRHNLTYKQVKERLS